MAIRALSVIVLALTLLFVAGAAADSPDPLSAPTGGDLVVSVWNGGVFDVNPDTGAARQILNGINPDLISFSQDGTRMLILNGPALMVADGDGSNAEQVSVDGPMDEARLSPDGTKIAFLRDGALYVRNLRDLASVRKITSPPPNTADNYPEWAPSSDRILVGRWTQPGGTAMVIVGVGGGEQEWMHDGGGSRFPEDGVWSSDGGRIATLEAGGVGDGGMHLTVWNADGTNAVVVTPNLARPAGYQPPAWSPDGRTLAYYNWDTSRVNLVGADGANLRTVFSANGYVSGVTWRPRGSGVTVEMPPDPGTLARRPLDISGTVRSIGSELAAAVTATIATTNGVIARASLNGSPCVAAGSTATCSVASLAGDTDAPLFVVVVPSRPGAATVNVSVRAANDAQHDDDAASLSATISQCTVLGTDGADRLAARGGDYVCGLGGDDVIRARNGKRDIIDGGSGNDTAIVDRIDVVRHVEHVKRPPR